MQPVSTDFMDRTFRYTQIERHGDIAIYCQEHKESHVQRFEVVRIRIRKAHTWPNGDYTPEHEAYPGANAWGTDGWTFFTHDAAQHFATTLIEEKQHAALVDPS